MSKTWKTLSKFQNHDFADFSVHVDRVIR